MSFSPSKGLQQAWFRHHLAHFEVHVPLTIDWGWLCVLRYREAGGRYPHRITHSGDEQSLRPNWDHSVAIRGSSSCSGWSSMQDSWGEDSCSLRAVWLTVSGWLTGPSWDPAASRFCWGPGKDRPPGPFTASWWPHNAYSLLAIV